MNLKYLISVDDGISERQRARNYGFQRPTLAQLKTENANPRLKTLERLAELQGRELYLATHAVNEMNLSDFSIPAVSLKASQDVFNSWKIHFFDFVDSFRKSKDLRLILLPPVSSLDQRRLALLASIVCALCLELELPMPAWVRATRFLSQPWFVSEMESLKAFAILESPIAFRRNNIFVLKNFLERV